MHGHNTSPADQIIRYPETSGFSAYTFSIWGFPLEEYPDTIRAYYKFCKEYFKKNGYRCDLLNVGYYIAQDTKSLFSYTHSSATLTLDPVSSGTKGWDKFLTAYNEFCSQHNGKPLFNQTPLLNPQQVKTAFEPKIKKFLAYRNKHDPERRFYNEFFRTLFEDE